MTLTSCLLAALVASPRPASADPQQEQAIRQQAQHWEQRLACMLHGELNVMRATCGDLPVPARRAILKAGQAEVKNVAMQVARTQMGQNKDQGDPLDSLRKTLDTALAEHADDKALAAYRREVQQREQRWREAVVMQVVMLLDADLYLTQAQREAVTKVLLEHFDPGMAAIMHMSGVDEQGRRTYVGLPDDAIRAHLTEAQRGRFRNQGDLRHNPWRQSLIWLHLQSGMALDLDPWWNGK